MEGNFLESSRTYFISYGLNNIETRRDKIVRTEDVAYEIARECKVKNVPGEWVYILSA